MKRALFVLVILIVAAVWVADDLGYIDVPVRGLVGQTASGAASGGGQRVGRRRGGQQNQDQPVPVLVAPVQVRDVPVTIESVGTVQALNTVTVRTQADGRLIDLAFKDGQDVKKGDVLARIDPATYQASYDQAVAKKAQDEAQLANARIDLDRYQKLAVSNYGSKQQSDTQKASVAQLEAQVRSDQASIDNAKAILDYTVIRAPLDGRTGIRSVDVGNIVHASDTSGLVVITQVKPIALLFTLPQQHLRTANAALAKGPVKVQALESDNARVLEEGRVDVVDNQVDPTTGTVRVKATFSNDDFGLWPGQFVNVRLFVDVLKDAIVAPTAAVQRGPDGAFVYVLRDDKVAMVKVDVQRQTETDAVLATGGVKQGDLVVTTGFSQLIDGRTVRADRPEAAAAPEQIAPAGTPAMGAATPAAGESQRRRRDGAGGPNGPGAGAGGGGQRRRDRAAAGQPPPADAAGTPPSAQGGTP